MTPEELAQAARTIRSAGWAQVEWDEPQDCLLGALAALSDAEYGRLVSEGHWATVSQWRRFRHRVAMAIARHHH